MSGTSQITRLGPAGLLQLEYGGGGGGEGEEEVCFRKTISLLHCQTRRRWGVTRRIGTYIKRTAKQLSVFLLISSEYCCWTRPGEVPGLHFSCNTIQVQNLTAL